MIRVSPGREEEFRYPQEWVASSATLDRVIDATGSYNDGSCETTESSN